MNNLINKKKISVSMEKKYIAYVLLLIFAVLAITSMTHNSATSDEVAHIAAGYSYWNYFDYRMNPEHPPLVKLWATLPLLFINPALPVYDYFEAGDEWEFGKQFLYFSGNNADQIYFWCRLMIVIIGIILGWYIFRWASELYGWKAGTLALLLYVFDPNIIAHSTVVHTDIPIAAALFIFMYYFWKYMQNTLHLKHLICLGTLAGICFAVKFTGVYILFLFVLLYFVHLYYEHTPELTAQKPFDIFVEKIEGFYAHITAEHGRILQLLGKYTLIITVIGFVILVATYGFANINQYIVGMKDVVSHSTLGHPGAYLFGMHSPTGWWYYFIVAFFVKTPVATILLFAAALYFIFQKQTIKNELFLLIPAGIYFVLFMFNNINIGVRHILPIYPFIFVMIGYLTTIELKTIDMKLAEYQKYVQWGLGLAVIWLIIANILIFPYYLTYFNELAGGAQNGHTILLDSNLDWGQGLKETALWLKEHNYLNQTIRSGYFGNEAPEYRGISWINIACTATPGVHIISANKLYDMFDNQYGCTEWLFEYEPIAIIGNSIYIYDIQDPTVIENYNSCKNDCTKACAQKGEMYEDSMYKDKCICICDEATNEELGIL